MGGIVDYLNGLKLDSSFKTRKKSRAVCYESMEFSAETIQLLNKLRANSHGVGLKY